MLTTRVLKRMFQVDCRVCSLLISVPIAIAIGKQFKCEYRDSSVAAKNDKLAKCKVL